MPEVAPLRKHMTLYVGLASALAVAGFLWMPVARSQQTVTKQAAKQASTTDAHRKLVGVYCTGCHSAKLKTGGLVLEGLSLDDVGQNAAIWEKVVRKLHGGQMPPQGMPKPPAESVASFTTYLETSLDKAAAKADPGRAPIHRSNRNEYANAIRD